MIDTSYVYIQYNHGDKRVVYTHFQPMLLLEEGMSEEIRNDSEAYKEYIEDRQRYYEGMGEFMLRKNYDQPPSDGFIYELYFNELTRTVGYVRMDVEMPAQEAIRKDVENVSDKVLELHNQRTELESKVNSQTRIISELTSELEYTQSTLADTKKELKTTTVRLDKAKTVIDTSNSIMAGIMADVVKSKISNNIEDTSSIPKKPDHTEEGGTGEVTGGVPGLGDLNIPEFDGPVPPKEESNTPHPDTISDVLPPTDSIPEKKTEETETEAGQPNAEATSSEMEDLLHMMGQDKFLGPDDFPTEGEESETTIPPGPTEEPTGAN